jgi:hypothetical protein
MARKQKNQELYEELKRDYILREDIVGLNDYIASEMCGHSRNCKDMLQPRHRELPHLMYATKA